MPMSRRVVMLVAVLVMVLFLGGVALGQSFQTSQMMGPMMQSPATDQMMGQMMQDPQMMQSMMNACARAMQDPQVQQQMQEMMQTPAMQQMMDQMLRQMPR